MQYINEAKRMQFLAGIINENYFYKSIIEEIDTNAIPQTVLLLENNFINNIQSNNYFTTKEKQVIALYLEHYDVFTEENINEFSSRLLNEGLKDWIGKAWGKIKNVFGSIKNFAAKVWSSIKKFVIESGKKAYNWAKNKLKAGIPKIKQELNNLKNKAQLGIEATHIAKVYAFLNNNIVSWFDSLGKKAEEKVVMNEIKEMIFNSTFTRLLAENAESIPTDITEPSTMDKLEELGIALKPLLLAFAAIFNPIKIALVTLFKVAAPKLLETLSSWVAKLGGPPPIKYVILPGIVAELAELAGGFNIADDILKTALSSTLAPIGVIVEVGHIIFMILAIFEILHEMLHGLSTKH